MKLVSVCVAIMLSAPLVLGTQATSVYNAEKKFPASIDTDIAFASARTVRCTTPAGALDAYGKALITQNSVYRAMCAPISEQAMLVEQTRDSEGTDNRLAWNTGLPCRTQEESGYAVYNLEPTGDDTYKCLVVTVLQDYPHRKVSEKNWNYVAAQAVKVEKEDGRWVVLPQEDFRVVEVLGDPWLTWGMDELPSYVFADTADGFRAEVHLQKVFTVDNTIQETNDFSWFFGPTVRYDTVPKPNATFSEVHWNNFTRCVYVGDEVDKAAITSVGLSIAWLEEDGSRPELRKVHRNEAGSSSDGSEWGGQSLGDDWGTVVQIGGGGTSSAFDKDCFELPEGYAGQLYINWEPTSELTLRLQEGGVA